MIVQLNLYIEGMTPTQLRETARYLISLADIAAHPFEIQKDAATSGPEPRRGRPRGSRNATNVTPEAQEADPVDTAPAAEPAPAEEDLFGEATPVAPETPPITMDHVVDAAKALGKRTSLNRVQALLQDDMKLPVGTKIKDVPADRWAELVTLANAIQA